MKSTTLILLVFFFSSVSAQQKSSPKDSTETGEGNKVFTFVERMPEYPGGDKALAQFLQKNIVYPPKDRNNYIEGKVIVKFVVSEKGKVEDVQVIRGVSPGLNAEAVRVVSRLKKFKPGRAQGKPVAVYYTIPIIFKLQ